MSDRGRSEASRWLKQAQVDLGWAQHLLEEGAYYLVCFLSQQAAEKALKAFLYWQGEEVVLGHSVRQLCEKAAGYDESFAGNCPRWGILDTYYIPTRYPNGLPDGTPAETYDEVSGREALSLAKQIVNHVASRTDLPADA